MTFAPQTLLDLAHLWVSNEGVNLGIVGDQRHTATGTSYHLGKDQLIAGAYSAVLARDKAGLTNAASALDLGQLHGSLHNLQKFSVWLVAEVRANSAKYRDIREVIYSPDGVKVLRWDNNLKALHTGGDGTGQGDNTHLWHTHISFYRDSEFRDKRPLFADYFAPATELPDTATEADLPTLAHYRPGSTITIKPTANIRADAKLSAKVYRALTAEETWVLTGDVVGDVDPEGGSNLWYVRWGYDRWEYTAKSNVTEGPITPAVAINAAYNTGVQDAAKASANGISALPKR